MDKYQHMLDYLYSLHRYGSKLGLEKITDVMNKLGNVQNKLKIIHVAGTNGKGSVCAMLSSILQQAGYSVGMFTSPHLIDFRERIQLNREIICEKDALQIFEKVKKTGVELTFFEFTTAMAFLYFSEKTHDYTILEVGMGGRLDATNIVKPITSVITTISFDHTNMLGNTLEKISQEKAGIIKENVPLFTTVNNKVIKDVCKEKNAKLCLVNNKENTNLNGEFQKTNAAVAAAVARYLKIKENCIKNGLMHVKWPARLEFIEKNVLLDCGHNSEGIKNIARFVEKHKHRKLIIVFGVMRDKNYKEMLDSLPKFDKIIFTKPQIERSLGPEELKKTIPTGVIMEDVAVAYEYAKGVATKDDLVLICGSCYLAGEVLAHIKNKPVTPIMFVQ
jgi:dihydrofolate synthase/folylpolyglutamate synthase